MADVTKTRDPIIAKLVQQRKERGLRQQAVADSAGISRRALVSIEAGNDCTLSTLRSLCDVLGVELQATAPTGPASAGIAPARAFRSAEALSNHQADRELAEALRVQSMPPAEFANWLTSTWGRLQDQANNLYAGVQRPPVGQSRHFKSLEDKNRFDEERETEFAVAVAMRQR